VATRTRELDEKNSLLDSILYAATDLAIIATDATLQINYFNPKAEQLFQMDKDKIIDQNVTDLHNLFSVSDERFEKILDKLKHHKNHSFSFQLEFSGKEKRVEAQLSSLEDSGKQQIGYVLLAKDVTRQHEQEAERKMLQEKLQRAQKMEAIGMMAAGIAHDLNNILSGMISYPELLLMELPQDSPLRRPITAIHDSGNRASDIVADLLTVARGVAAAKETLNLNSLILEHLNSPEHHNFMSQHQGISCSSTLSPELYPVFCSKVHIRKCLLNLITNGAEAIQEEGLITIATRNQFIEDNLEGKQALKQGFYVVLAITDSGAAISEEDIQRIFDPFYTKKILGRSSTGMGLSVIWNTVEEHDGHITIQSSEQGTCFEIYLPVSKESVQQEDISPKTESQDLHLHGQGEKILVVDDEPMQRDVADIFLSKLGYHVETVSSGEGAVLYLQSHSADLVILDMNMDPGINGRQTYELIIQNNPGQKTIIASGFSEDEEITETLQMGAGQLINKPYSIRSLGLAVRQELHGMNFLKTARDS
jgi:PAS domain S-box-containing protein